jgi:hypothetical protein
MKAPLNKSQIKIHNSPHLQRHINQFRTVQIPYLLKSILHSFYSFRGLKYMQIRTACGLDSKSRAEFWKNDGTDIEFGVLMKLFRMIVMC